MIFDVGASLSCMNCLQLQFQPLVRARNGSSRTYDELDDPLYSIDSTRIRNAPSELDLYTQSFGILQLLLRLSTYYRGGSVGPH